MRKGHASLVECMSILQHWPSSFNLDYVWRKPVQMMSTPIEVGETLRLKAYELVERCQFCLLVRLKRTLVFTLLS